MVVEKDIVAISIPFSAGVALTAILPSGIELSYTLAAAGSAAAAVLLVMLCMLRKADVVLAAALFFVLGVLCGANSNLSFSAAADTWRPAAAALSKLGSLIDSLGLRHEDSQALMKALLTGQKSELSAETVKVFRASGASHILALSGLHLGVIYGLLTKSLAWMGHSRAAAAARSLLIIAASAFFAIMTGAGPSIVRAFLFIVIGEISSLTAGRRRRPTAVLCTALMIQLLFKPSVISTLGFQLSYLAMLGIVTVFPKMEKWYPESRTADPMRRIWKAMALTLSCQLFTAPLVWARFHTFPKYFLLTNLLALPLCEVFITAAVAALLLSGFGICPQILKDLTDTVGQVLIKSLETIASLTS